MSAILESGHTVKDLEDEELLPFADKMVMYKAGAIRLMPEGWFFPKSYEKYANLIFNFKVKPTDVFTVAFPKSGTNWIQEIVYTLISNPDLDNPDADIPLDARCPYLDIDYLFEPSTSLPPLADNGEVMKRLKKLCPEKNDKENVFYNLASFTPDPRVIKTHLGCTLMPKEVFKSSKIVYLARDVRDCIVSFQHFFENYKVFDLNGTLEEMAEDFINNRVFYGPFYENLRQAWERRNDSNFLFLYYEDLKSNPHAEFRKIAEFLGVSRTDKQIDNVVEFTSFSTMKVRTKDNPPTNFDYDDDAFIEKTGFFRKGEAGTWKEDFTPEIEAKVNAWMRENLVKFSDDFKYKKEFKF